LELTLKLSDTSPPLWDHISQTWVSHPSTKGQLKLDQSDWSTVIFRTKLFRNKGEGCHNKNKVMLGKVTHACNISEWEAKTGR
jgi:hypothetical protein